MCRPAPATCSLSTSRSGAILWAYRANLEAAIGTSSAAAGRAAASRTAAARIFLGQLDGKLVALDAKTGAVAWSVQAERWQDGFSITSAPLYYDGLVITGFSGAELGVRGRVKAFDARDGKLVWTFYTIPGRGEPGNETWPQDNEVWQHGGGTVWHTPAARPRARPHLFLHGQPWPRFQRRRAHGRQPLHVVDRRRRSQDRRYRWHFQQVHHDIWDFDSPSPVVLFDLTIDGRERRGLAQPSKTGWVYILDRTDGTPLVGIDEQPVPQEPRQATAATQPLPRGDAFVPQHLDIAPEGYPLVNGGRIFTPFWTDYVIAKPGILGRRELAAERLRSCDGLFVCVRRRRRELVQRDGYRHRASGRGRVLHRRRVRHQPAAAVRHVHGARLAHEQDRLAAALGQHVLQRRRRRRPAGSCSSAATTAGSRRSIPSDGKKLWEFQTGAGMNAPVSVFEHLGKQYVVAYSAGNLFAGSAKGDSVWLFALDGTLEPAAPPQR